MRDPIRNGNPTMVFYFVLLVEVLYWSQPNQESFYSIEFLSGLLYLQIKSRLSLSDCINDIVSDSENDTFPLDLNN